MLILSAITRLCRGLGLNSLPKQDPRCNSIKTLLQSSKKPQNGYQMVFNNVIVFSHVKVYIWQEFNPHRIYWCTPTWSLFYCSVHQYGRGGREGGEIFFHVEITASILYRPTLWWGYRMSSDSAVPYLLHSHSLCCQATLLAIAGRQRTAE